MSQIENRPATSAAKVQLYVTTSPLLKAMQEELREFAKKKPEATLSKSKVSLINRLFSDVKELLKDEDTSKYLDPLDEETLPQYSDVVLIGSQYLAALDAFHDRYFTRVPGSHGSGWAIK